MNIPETKLHQLIDSLTKSSVSFALYRLPWTDEPILVLQESREVETLNNLSDLNGKRGFVLTPFQHTSTHPGVIIRPDKVARDWEQIGLAVSALVTDKDYDEEEAHEGAGLGVCGDEVDNKLRYTEAFTRFIAPLQQKIFKKLVLSRREMQMLPEKFSLLTAFVNACNSYPRMMISLTHTPVTGTWIGCTPEIILSGQENQWHTVSLAGTMPMDGEAMPEHWSDKNREEQAFVSEYIRKTIKKFGSKLTENGPYTARAGQLVHLKTDFHFCLKKTEHLGDILNELHPTPAVCGLPKQQTYDFILDNEGYDRSYYSGIIGWLDPQEHTTLYVNLRCMRVSGKQALLYAGGGILASSTADTEWEETQHKMNTMKKIITL